MPKLLFLFDEEYRFQMGKFQYNWKSTLLQVNTVKLGDKERFDRKQIGSWFFVTNLPHKDKEHLSLRNNFRVLYLITKFDCSFKSGPLILEIGIICHHENMKKCNFRLEMCWLDEFR